MKQDKLALERAFITLYIQNAEINRDTFDDEWWWQEEHPDKTRIIPGRKFEFDFVHKRHKVAVEIQGGTWVKGAHSTGSGIRRDCEKQNLAMATGYKLYAFTSDMLKGGDPTYLLLLIEQVRSLSK